MKLHINLTAKIAIAIFIFTLAIYSFTANRHNPGYADSDEMITIGYLLGTAHPSGYPLQMWLTKFITLIPLPGSIGFRANIMNSFFHSLTLLVIFYIGITLIGIINPQKEKKDKTQLINAIIAASGTLLLAFSGLFWLYSGVAEVMALNDFLASLAVLVVLKWYQKLINNEQIDKSEFRLFWLSWALSGLGMAHVHTFILIFPFLGIMLLLGLFKYRRFKLYGLGKIVIGILLFIIIFAIPNISQLYLNSRKQNVSWYFEQTLSGLYDQVRRKVYSGYIPEKDLHVRSYIANIDFGHYIKSFPFYWEFMLDHFTFLGVSLGLLGIVWIWVKKRELALSISALVLTSGLFIGIYMGVPDKATASLEYRSQIGISHRQYLIGETMWGIAMILGFLAVLEIVKENIKQLKHKQLLIGASVFCSISVIILFLSNFRMGYQRNVTHAIDYAKAVLEPLPQGAILMCFADFSCFSLMYAQEVEGIRTDVNLVSKNIYIKGHWLRKNPWLKGLEDTDNPYFSADIVSWNLYNNRRVFTTDSVGYYVTYIGLEGNPFFIVPNGYTFEIVKKVPGEVPAFDYGLTEKLISYERPEADYWFNGQKDYFANYHTINALVYSYLGYKDEAVRNIKLALALTPDYQTARTIYQDIPKYSGNLNYRLGQESSPSAYYLDLAKKLLQQKQLDPAYKTLQKATFIDPKNIEARSMLAELLIGGKFYSAARMEYKNLLRFYPDDEKIKQRLQEIENLN